MGLHIVRHSWATEHALISATLLYAIVPSFYFPDTLWFSVSAIMPSENKISFTASFLIRLHVVSLSCFIVWTTVMNRRSKLGHTCLESFFYHDWVWILPNSFPELIGIIMNLLHKLFLNSELASHIWITPLGHSI